ncbi:MAG: hypothetical protein IJR99_03385 [Kiritimatiellae bacterium]|nr:hypothetical protein [Kiritimatiellia bacterium]
MVEKLQRITVGAIALTGVIPLVAWGADSTVPADWNVAPITSGAYIETFNALPAWATGAGEVTAKSGLSASSTGLPDRTNNWFAAGDSANTVLALDTAGTIITNTLGEGENNYVPVSSDNPVYFDLLVRFDPVDSIMDESMFNESKLSLYINSDKQLVCRTTVTNIADDLTLDTNTWYRLTVKMMGSTFSVLLNDQPLTFNSSETLSINTAGESGQITQARFCGTGHLDDLYISHQSPAYAVAGASSAPSVTLDSYDGLADESKTSVLKWLADNSADLLTAIAGGSTVLAEATGLTAYVLNTPGLVASSAGESQYALGIAGIDVLSDTQVQVTVSLSVLNTEFTGSINGVLKLEGKQSSSDAAFTVLTETTFTGAAFTSGSATFTFTIPAGYRIFKPVITVE